MFVVSGGFGAKPYTSGGGCFGAFLFDGEQCRMEGYMVERFATEDEIAAAKAIREETISAALIETDLRSQGKIV